jgi:hypothetical protein
MSSRFEFRHAKTVALVEAALASAFIIFGLVNASRGRLRPIFVTHAAHQIFPEGNRFGVRIIDAKDAHPAPGPKRTMLFISAQSSRQSSQRKLSG